MASPQAAAIDQLFDSFLAALAANPQMSLEDMRDMLEKCGDSQRLDGDAKNRLQVPRWR